jgi:hypothetical protein
VGKLLRIRSRKPPLGSRRRARLASRPSSLRYLRSNSGSAGMFHFSWYKVKLRILVNWNNSFLEGKNSKLAREDASEIPVPRNHARVIVSVARILDAPRSSSYQALAKVTHFMHYLQYGPKILGILLGMIWKMCVRDFRHGMPASQLRSADYYCRENQSVATATVSPHIGPSPRRAFVFRDYSS